MTVQLEIKERDGERYYKTYRYGKPVWKRAPSTISTVPLGNRYYLDARTGVAHPSVTSILAMEPAPGLENWKRQNVAKAAHRSAHFIRELPEAAAVSFLLKEADSNDAADKGSEFHDFAERMVLGQQVRESDVPERVRPHYRRFVEFLDAAQPEVHSAEKVAWSDTHGFSGSYDLLATFRVNPQTKRLDPQGERATVMLDYKSGRKIYPKVGVQLAGYAMADKLVGFDGEEIPMPEIHMGAVLHINEDVCELRPVNIGDRAQSAFLAMLRFYNDLSDWESSTAGIIGRPWYKQASETLTGTERRS